MRPTKQAHISFNSAIKKAGEVKSLQDLGNAVQMLADGCSMMNLAIQQTYDKLEQIDRKLSSASTHRRPTM
jgi:hypothetical protein